MGDATAPHAQQQYAERAFDEVWSAEFALDEVEQQSSVYPIVQQQAADVLEQDDGPRPMNRFHVGAVVPAAIVLFADGLWDAGCCPHYTLCLALRLPCLRYYDHVGPSSCTADCLRSGAF